MNLSLILATLCALATGYWAWDCHRRALPGMFHLLLSANGAVQGLIGGFGLSVAILFVLERGTGLELGFDEPVGLDLRRAAAAFLASGLPVVAIHMLYLVPAWSRRQRSVVLALSTGLSAWALASLLVGLLVVGLGFYPAEA